jgi:CRISPR/Cas system CMR-associated protein Cmr5 small subunit
MQNLEQIRAARALADQSKTTKRDVTKLPALIVNNGLLAATAFAAETNDKGRPKRRGMKAAMDSVALHLSNPQLGLPVMKDAKEAADIISRLTKAPAASGDLQRASGEALNYIAYLKRFAQKAGDESEQEEE